jgi:hypothetical protein
MEPMKTCEAIKSCLNRWNYHVETVKATECRDHNRLVSLMRKHNAKSIADAIEAEVRFRMNTELGLA